MVFPDHKDGVMEEGIALRRDIAAAVPRDEHISPVMWWLNGKAGSAAPEW
ncbi:hypothetical protein ACIBBB_18290 [Streptomyces sp. NPDC051217]